MRSRTGVLVIPEIELGTGRLNWPHALNIDHVDLAKHVLATLGGSRFVPRDVGHFVGWLREIATARAGGNCVLVSNADLLLVRLGEEERNEFWQWLLERFAHCRRGLIITLPQKGLRHLMSSQTEAIWRRARLAEFSTESNEGGN